MRDRLAGGVFQSAAARDLHAREHHAAHVVLREDRGQLLLVVRGVQLRAADERHAAADEVRVKIPIGIGRAVGGDEQVAAVKIRRADRHEPQLDRPVLQLSGRGLRRGGRMVHGTHLRAGAAAGQLVRGGRAGLFGRLHVFYRLGRQLFELCALHGSLVIGRGLPLDNMDRVHRTDRQAVAQPVTVIVADQLRLPVHDGDRALMARLGAQAAARASGFVDGDDGPFHVLPSCSRLASSLARRSASAFS